ncbi:unnamed protein product [Linum trigynum]
MKHLVLPLLLIVSLSVIVSQASNSPCKGKLSLCKNMEAACEKSCPGQTCTIECSSCQPICTGGSGRSLLDDGKGDKEGDDKDKDGGEDKNDKGEKGGDDKEGGDEKKGKGEDDKEGGKGEKGGDDKGKGDDDKEGGKGEKKDKGEKGGDDKEGDDEKKGKGEDDKEGGKGEKGGDDKGIGDDDKEGGKGEKDGDDKGKGKGDDDKEGGKGEKGDEDSKGGKGDNHDSEGDHQSPSSSPTLVPAAPIPTPTPPPTPTGTPPASPPTPSAPYPPKGNVPKKSRCMNKNYNACYYREFLCPSNCPYDCVVDCVTCRPVCSCDKPGAVCQDPRFIGGDGITFYFHGKKDRDFCLVSDENLHINAHFIGKRNPKMTRDFTWVQSIAIFFDSHRITVGALKTTTWDDSVDRLFVTFDGEPLLLPERQGASWESGATATSRTSVTRSADANSVVVEVEGKLRIAARVVPITQEDSRIHNYGVTSSDCLAHLDLGFRFDSLSGDVNGVLGQTYRAGYVSPVSVSAKMAVMGGERMFETSSLYAPDCKAARFVGSGGGGSGATERVFLPSLKCESGIEGRGVVCKR